jgi:hypothetical protein
MGGGVIKHQKSIHPDTVIVYPAGWRRTAAPVGGSLFEMAGIYKVNDVVLPKHRINA